MLAGLTVAGPVAANGESTTTTTTVAPTTTTTTVVVDTGSDILNPIASNGGLTAGRAKATLDGANVPVSLSTNGATKTVKGEGFEMSLSGLDQNRRSIDLDANDAVRLVPGGLARVAVDGFAPGTEVFVYLLSDPVLLGMYIPNAEGRFGARMVMPDDIEPGVHTVQVNGFTTDGKVRSLNLGVVVSDGVVTSDTLPATGADSFPLSGLALMVLALGAMVLVSRRRLVQG